MNIWANCDNCRHYDDDSLYCNDCLATRPPSKWEAAGHYHPPTNADRIRSMTDEELADVLDHACPLDNRGRDCGEDIEEFDKCKKCWLGWLKQPYEEATW